MKVVIIGGVAGGASAAARIRRLDEKAQIIILERSGYVSYANCGLPYYVGGVITDKEALTLQAPKRFWSRFHVDVRTKHEAIDLNVKAKVVTVRELRTGAIYQESYDKLILAPGAMPALPGIPGTDSERVFALRNIEDTDRIRMFVEDNQPKTVAIVGGGYIGLEMAENLQRMGVQVVIIQRSKQLMSVLDCDMARLVRSECLRHCLDLILGGEVVEFRDFLSGVDVVLANRGIVHADMVLVAMGVIPDSSLAQRAGLLLGTRGTIVVDDRMETSAVDVFAVGDVVQVKHAVSGQNDFIPLAGPANKQGRIAADNICGGDSRYQGSLGSSIVKLFDLTIACTGLSEKAAQAAGFEFDKVVLSPASHAGYYPGAKSMTMKVVFEKKTCRLLGAQIIGSDGVDKRIDVLATAISCGVRADKLKDLDLAYAPPFSSAKDPVNMAGFMIENIVTGKVKQFHWDEVASLPRDGRVTLLDTRTVAEYERGHLEGFINIPLDDLRDRMSEIEFSKPVFVMCHSGMRSYIACRILSQEGFDCYNLSGGYQFYASVVRS